MQIFIGKIKQHQAYIYFLFFFSFVFMKRCQNQINEPLREVDLLHNQINEATRQPPRLYKSAQIFSNPKNLEIKNSQKSKLQERTEIPSQLSK